PARAGTRLRRLPRAGVLLADGDHSAGRPGGCGARRGAAARRRAGGPLPRQIREDVASDLERVRRYLEDPGRLPRARGIALFACRPLGLFEVVPLPRVYRSRLRVEPLPLIRELVAIEEE